MEKEIKKEEPLEKEEEPILETAKITEEKEGASNIEMAWQAHTHNGINSAKLDFGSIDHGSLSGLSDDDHTIYYKSGREPNHGALGGLADDDHTQYHNDARGDARYIKKDGSVAYTGTGTGFKDEDDMSSDSATAVASQQSIKKYVDDSITAVVAPNIILGAMKDYTANANLFTAQITFTNDIYWAIGGPDTTAGLIGWADKPTGFSSYFSQKTLATSDRIGGLVEIGNYVYTIEYDGGNWTSYRYDAKSLANKTAMSGGVIDRAMQMAYDGTYVYTAIGTVCRRMTISGTVYTADTGYNNGGNNYRTLNESVNNGFFADGAYLYFGDQTDKKIYKYTIADDTVNDFIAFDTNVDMDETKGAMCGVVKIGTQWYMFYDIHDEWGATTSYTRPTTLVGIPFSW